MTRDDAIAMLPCYASGDLPPERLAAIDALVSSDPELERLVADLRDQHERARRALLQDHAPLNLFAEGPLPHAVPTSSATPTSDRRPPNPFVVVLLALAAAALLTVGLSRRLGPSTTPPEADVSTLAQTFDIATSGRLVALDPHQTDALERAFDSADVPETLRVVPDLAHLGYETVAVYVLPGKPSGVAVHYRRDGIDYLCQMWLGLEMPAHPDVLRTIAGTTLHGLRDDPVSSILWEVGDMSCVWSASLPLDRLVATMEERLAHPG